MDRVVIPDLKTQCLLIRFAIVCPAILLSLFVTYTKFHYRLRIILILICCSLSSLGIIYIIAHASSLGNHIYYDGLVLQRVADTINGTIRKPDTACRYGGEEFVVLLPETDVVAVEKLAQRLLEAIAETTVANNETLLGVTASLGVGTLGDDEVAASATLLERADQALYAAKNSGRNQLRVWRKSVSDNIFDGFSAVPPIPPG